MDILKKKGEREEWLLCPICGRKTRDRIREDTVLIHYPLYCPKCGQTTLVNAENLRVTPSEDLSDKEQAEKL